MTPLELKQQAALASINDMMARGYFNICTLDAVAKMFDILPEKEAYKVLATLHCVHFKDMSRELYASTPALIQQALRGIKVFQFDLREEKELMVVTGPVETRKPPLLRRIFTKQG